MTMMMMNRRFFGLLALAAAIQPLAFGFSVQSQYSAANTALHAQANNNDDTGPSLSRRSLFEKLAASAAVGAASAFMPSQPASAESTPKVLVLGGTGFVGSRVVQKLKGMGVEVIATSRDGRDGTVAFDATSTGLDVSTSIANLCKGCTAVISCIGAIGTEKDGVINSATGLAALGAKSVGVDRFVYISVAPEVKEFAKNIDFLKPYMTGKTFSQNAVTSNFPSGYTLIEPTFIQGGDDFNINPPRVAGFYGDFIEFVLSSPPLRAITTIAPEGILKIALEPPNSVDSVASAAVAGALGKTQAVLDSYDKIKEAGNLLK